MNDVNNYDYRLERRLRLLSSELFKKYRDCMSTFSKMLERYSAVFPTFTDHSLLHSMSVVNYSNMLLADEADKLNAEEIYAYLMAVSLHDMGMAVKKEKFPFYVKEAHIEDYVSGHPDENYNVITRKHHHIFSSIFIMNNYELFDIPGKDYAKAISQIAKGHRVEDLFNKETYPIDFEVGDNKKINLPVLGALLRLADEMDYANDRNLGYIFDAETLHNWDGKDKSVLEYLKIATVKRIYVEGENIVVNFDSDEKMIIDGMEEFALGLQKKLDYCREVIMSNSNIDIRVNKVKLLNDRISS